MDHAIDKLVSELESEGFNQSSNSFDLLTKFLQYINLYDLCEWLALHQELIQTLKDPIKSLFNILSEKIDSIDLPTNLSEEELQLDYVPALIEACKGPTSLLKTLYRLSDLKKLKESSTTIKITPKVKRQAPSSSAGTQKKKKATTTSTTSATTTNQIVDVSTYEESTSSDVDIQTLLAAIPSKKNTSTISSTIYLKNQGNLYTFKSDQFPMSKKFISLQIWDHPSQLEDYPENERWKCASMRVKMAVGRQGSVLSDQILKKLQELKDLLIKDSQTFPGMITTQTQLKEK